MNLTPERSCSWRHGEVAGFRMFNRCRSILQKKPHPWNGWSHSRWII